MMELLLKTNGLIKAVILKFFLLKYKGLRDIFFQPMPYHGRFRITKKYLRKFKSLKNLFLEISAYCDRFIYTF